jgi:hypothetical protein
VSFQVHDDDDAARDRGPSLSGFAMFVGLTVLIGGAVVYLGPRFVQAGVRGGL